MSGGRWNYSRYQMAEYFTQISQDTEVSRRWPQTAYLFWALGALFQEWDYLMDMDLSGDTSVGNDREFEKLFIARLENIVRQYTHGN